MEQAYREDLAYIHDAGFGHLADEAGSVVIGALRRAGVNAGTIVDLGCGSGITARLLSDAGYDVVGIDLSEPLLRIARRRVPDATFRAASFVTADIPPCVAVTAIGEVFNYRFDTTNGAAVLAGVFERVYAALQAGGLFLFDIAGPARAPASSPQRTFAEGADWAVLVEVEAARDSALLTRRISSFRKCGALYRRDFETHRLRLIDPAEAVASLQRSGFTVQQLDRYGPLVLPQGLVGFLASKPGRVADRPGVA